VVSDTFIDYSPVFHCEGLRAGFSFKSGDFSPNDDRWTLAQSLGLNPERIVIPKQTHTNKVQIVEYPGAIPETDGIVTGKTGLVLSIQVADCIPLYLLDPRKKIIGLVHAGWRGTAAQIGKQAMRTFRELGSNLSDIVALMGPSIHVCCFEVGVEVAKQFPAPFSERNGNKYDLDLTAALNAQLAESGVPDSQITVADECTCCHPERYHSYRREGKKAGRMIALFGWKELSN